LPSNVSGKEAALLNVVNVADIDAIVSTDNGYWHSIDKPLTPALEPRMGRLGMVMTRVPGG